MHTESIQTTTSTDEREAMAALLETGGDYRILRRLDLARHLHPDIGAATHLGIMLDVETTGLDPARDEIIELAMVPFLYTADGKIVAVRPAFDQLRQPTMPIPDRITQLTGITDAMVDGQVIDPAEVAAFVAQAALIVAHNASFDRRFAERFCDAFMLAPWACSLKQIDWQASGYEGTKLTYLLAGAGQFSTCHRALDDCHAAIALLARELPGTGQPALIQLLRAAAHPTVRLWATSAPFACKDLLKDRGYRWNSGADGRPKAWFIDLDPKQREAELAFLRAEIFHPDHCPPETLVTAHDRFSDRV